MIHAVLPERLRPVLARARRLEWWSIAWTLSVIAVMGAAMGSSQTMKIAWIEDCLSLVPPAVFLISAHLERRPPTALFPNGFARAPSVAFALAAAALTALGGVLLIDSAMSLIAREHATVASLNHRWHRDLGRVVDGGRAGLLDHRADRARPFEAAARPQAE